MNLAKMWTSFEQNILKDCSAIQRLEMRKAFYAGAFASFVRITHLPEDKEGALKVFAAMRTELREFMEEQVTLRDKL